MNISEKVYNAKIYEIRALKRKVDIMTRAIHKLTNMLELDEENFMEQMELEYEYDKDADLRWEAEND